MKLSELKTRSSNECDVTSHLNGVKEQTYVIDIKSTKADREYFIFINGESQDFDSHMLSDEGDIQLEVGISSDFHRIDLVYKQNDAYYHVWHDQMNIWKKIKRYIFLFCSVIKLGCIVFARGVRFLWREHHFIIPPALWKKYFDRFFYRMKQGGEVLWNPFIQADYTKWVKEHNEVEEVKDMDYRPLMSILIPIYNVAPNILRECVASVLAQSYPHFELILVDDHSSKQETLDVLKELETTDERIKISYRKTNGHISKATNDALALAKGEYICLMDNDDVLTKDALYENVKALNEDQCIDMLYSDEDKLDTKGVRCEPHFKPDYSPDTLLGINYICHFAVLRRCIVHEIGGFRVGYEGAQDHDLFLRFCEKTSRIHHIPKILYQWRMVEGSTSMKIDNKNYAVENGIRAIEDALQRRNTTGTVKNIINSTVYLIDYIFDKEPLVSIIIPTRDLADITRTCLTSIYEKTKYENFEIIMVDNNSIKNETFALFSEYEKAHDNFHVVKADMEFNYSKINNLAVEHASGDVLLFLNNDTEIISSDWLRVMASYAMQPHIGTVGAKLLYPDMTIQHAGVLLGLGGGVACHAYLEAKREDHGMYGRLLIPYNYSAVTAACMAVRTDKFKSVGGFEEGLKVAYNDVDLNLKLLSKGYYNVCTPHVELIHYESKSRGLDSTSEKYKLFLSESDYMFQHWGSLIENDPYYNPNFSKKGLYLLDKKK